MRLWLPVFLMMFAGCVQPTPGTDAGGTTDPRVLMECPLLPDGTPMACEATKFVQAEAGRPDLGDGWKCVQAWGEENVHTESYSTVDGRVGFYWEWERWKEDGLAFQSLAWLEGEGEGTVLLVPYQTSGFVSLPPQDPDGPVEIHHMFRQYRAHAHVDGHWTQPDNVTFLLDNVGGDLWWAVRFDWPGGPYFVNPMEEDRREDRMSIWNGDGWRGFVGGTEVILDSTGNGIKNLNVDFEERKGDVDPCSASQL